MNIYLFIFFLGVLQQTLPSPVYALLLQNLDKAQKRVRDHTASSFKGLGKKPERMDAEDVE